MNWKKHSGLRLINSATIWTQQNINIADTYHKWRNKDQSCPYEDKSGFCKSATLEEVKKNNYVLMPGRYVGTEIEEKDTVPFGEKMKNGLFAILNLGIAEY